MGQTRHARLRMCRKNVAVLGVAHLRGAVSHGLGRAPIGCGNGRMRGRSRGISKGGHGEEFGWRHSRGAGRLICARERARRAAESVLYQSGLEGRNDGSSLALSTSGLSMAQRQALQVRSLSTLVASCWDERTAGSGSDDARRQPALSVAKKWGATTRSVEDASKTREIGLKCLGKPIRRGFGTLDVFALLFSHFRCITFARPESYQQTRLRDSLTVAPVAGGLR
jgi:hypothetical protein